MEYKIDNITPQDIEDDYYLKLFLINNLDTNLISIFIPEIWKDPSEFVLKDSNGKIITHQT